MNISTLQEWTGATVDWIASPGLSILIIVFIGLVAYNFGGAVVAQLIRKAVRPNHLNSLTPEDAIKRQNTLISLFSAFLKFVIAVITISVVVEQAFPNINLAPLFASAGIIGIALGFGAQSIIKDLFSGFFIIMENQYRVGDTVDIEGAAGTVERINIRSTVLRDFDGNVHFLPNGTIAHVINKTMGFSKANFTVTIRPDSDLDKVTAIINKVGQKLAKDKGWSKKIINAPMFWNIGNFTDVSLDVTIVATTEPSEQWSVTGEMRRRLLDEFGKQNIELAHAPVGFGSKKK